MKQKYYEPPVFIPYPVACAADILTSSGDLSQDDDQNQGEWRDPTT